MEVHEIITTLTTHGAKIEVVDDQLKINVNKSIITPEMQSLIKNNKREIIDFIGRKSSAIKPAPAKQYYALSSQQQRLYFLYELDPLSLPYNESAVYRLRGQLDRERLQQAFRNLLARHEILRTSFHVVDAEPKQMVVNDVDFEIEYYRDNGDIKKIIKDFVRPFILSIAPLIRVGLIQLDEPEHLLMVDLHHIITDGVSKGVLVTDFMALYNGEQLPPPALHYKDFAEWQQSPERQQQLLKQKAFWQQLFSEYPAAADLPADFPRPLMKTYAGMSTEFELDAGVTAKLLSIAAQEHTTLYNVLLCIYVILLSKLSNQEDIVIGTPTAGRQHADLEKMMGLFVNTLALRLAPTGNFSFKEFLNDVTNRTVACFDNQDYPYELLIDDLKVMRDTSRNPLFDAFFLYHNFERFELSIPGLQLSTYERDYPISKFDITLEALQSGEKISLKFEYSTELFKPSTIHRFIEYFTNITAIIINDANVKISGIDILPETERKLLVHDFNNTYLDYPRNASISTLFEEQVRNTPDAIAVISRDGQLSYAELNNKANAIAAYLGDCRGALIGVMAERDINLLPCLLGVLKSGAGYVPIDPSYPEERVKYVIEDSGIKQLLTSDLIKDLPIATPGKIEAAANDPAYMIYTSGSTGKPKGVTITHGNVINFIYGTREMVSFNGGSRMLCITTISFDIFVLESLFPLLSGMTIVLATTADQKDPDALVKLINQQQVDFIQMTPSHVKLLLGSGQGTEALQNIKALMLGGEALPGELVDELREHYSGKIYNMYGPTETTVYSCVGEAHAGERVTIGKPIANTIIRVLDKYGKLAPLGVPGELCIGGEGVSKGYWHRPELTAEKFIKDDWGTGLLYRTGDLARWRADGEVLCLGRIDQQVKVRGHRIEPGEIEAQLNNHEAIIRSAVDAKGQGSDKYLVAYYEANEEIDPAVLRAHLSQALPAYMIPGSFMKLGKLPLTPNGKLDRKALPDPFAQAGANYVAPSNATEEKLVELWSEVLRLDSSLISVTRNFFELGGHSLRAIYLVNKIEQRFGVRIGIREVFENISVRKLAEMISVRGLKKRAIVPKAEKRKYYPASSAQERLYYQQLLHEDRVTNNLPMIVSIKGNWSMERLQQSLQTLVNIHESLRTYFSLNEEGVVQQVQEHATIQLEMLHASSLEQAFENFVRPFNLEACPLMRCGLLFLENETFLLVDVHHIVCDAVSLDILMTHFKNIYKGNMPTAPDTTYIDYACWQRRQTNHLKAQEQFWLQQLSGELPRLDLPTLRSRETTDIHAGATEIMIIKGEQYDQLKKYTATSRASIFMFLLSAYYMLLSKLSGNKDIIIGTDAIGRSMPELRSVTGTFINVLPLRLQVQEDARFEEVLQQVKDLVLNAFENQDYQYDQMCVLAGKKIVDVYFSDASLFENEVQLQDVEFLPVERETATRATRYELELRIDDRAGQISITFLYSTDLYDADTIKYFMKYYSGIIQSVISQS